LGPDLPVILNLGKRKAKGEDQLKGWYGYWGLELVRGVKLGPFQIR